MKNIILIATLFFCAPEVNANIFELVPPDKQMHFFVSMSIAGITYQLTDSIPAAIAVTLSIGILKELTDSKVNTMDMYANFAGIAGALMVPIYRKEF